MKGAKQRIHKRLVNHIVLKFFPLCFFRAESFVYTIYALQTHRHIRRCDNNQRAEGSRLTFFPLDWQSLHGLWPEHFIFCFLQWSQATK